MLVPEWLNTLIPRRTSRCPFPADSPLGSLRYVVVDTELTSLDRRFNRVLSIGAMVMDGKKIRLGQEFYRVVNPGISVPAETAVIHGLRTVDVLEGATPATAIKEFLDFAGTALLVGHFVEIDLAALRKEIPGQTCILSNPAIDTRMVQRWLDNLRNAYREDRGHQVENVDLASLAKRYGLEVPEAHHALQDALLTAQLWQRLMYELEAVRLTRLKDLLRIAGRS